MVQVSYPGVYIQEVPSGVHTITSVATSITAFIDWFKEGPSNKAVEIFGMTDFGRVFGGLDDRSEASYAISQFFLNGGGTALVVRVAAAGSAVKAGIKLHSNTVSNADVLDVTAANEGVWGNNLRLDIDYNTIDPSTKEVGTLFNLTVTRYDGPGLKAKAIATESFLNLTLDPSKPRYAKRVINDGSSLIQVDVPSSVAATDRPAACGTTSGPLTQAALDALGTSPSPGKSINVAIGTEAHDVSLGTWSAGTGITQIAQQLQQAIRAASPNKNPSFTGAVVEAPGNRLRILSSKTSGTYDPSEFVTISNVGADHTAQDVLALTGSGPTNVQQYRFGLAASPPQVGALEKGNVGADGNSPAAGDLVGAPGDPPTGMFALDRADLFNILCIPCAAAAKLGDSDRVTVVSAALKYCDDRRAFMIIDVPEDRNTVQKMKDWLDQHDGFRNNNSALYFPHPRIPDPKNEFRLRTVGASGTMAGIYARTDSARGVWKAPAGIEATLSGVAELDAKLTDAQNGTLNPLGINCLRAFPIYGAIAWGARTLEGADQIGSEWKYIPIRRLALMLEESLFRGTKWVVFEPNDEPLWAKIRLNINAYMMSLFRQGAFQGTNPKDAFFVKCDAETTTQDDRNKGIVNILVGFAPLKPAEFVVISIQQIAGNL